MEARPSSLPSLLGWSGSLFAQFGVALDGSGSWVAAPDGQLLDERADLTWLAWGAWQGLFDARHALVIVGFCDLTLTGRAYGWDEGQPVSIECSFDVERINPFAESGE